MADDTLPPSSDPQNQDTIRITLPQTVMSDEIPPAPSETQNLDDVTKSETIRITLPPKSDQPAMKRETVRINVPGKPVAPGGVFPKKETTKLPGAGSTPAPGARPFVPPPSAPRPPGIPSAAVKPMGGATLPPKPPALGARPTVPLKPAAVVTEPITQRAAAPKKETARITLPPEGGSKPGLPKATVKMQQTQPLVNRPAPAMNTAPALAHVGTGVAEADPMVVPLSIAAVVLSLIALITSYLAYAAASTSAL